MVPPEDRRTILVLGDIAATRWKSSSDGWTFSGNSRQGSSTNVDGTEIQAKWISASASAMAASPAGEVNSAAVITLTVGAKRSKNLRSGPRETAIACCP